MRLFEKSQEELSKESVEKSLDIFMYILLAMILIYYIPSSIVPTFFMKEELLLEKQFNQKYLSEYNAFGVKEVTASTFHYGAGCRTRYTVKFEIDGTSYNKSGWNNFCPSQERKDLYDLKVINTGDKLKAYTLFSGELFTKEGLEEHMEYSFYNLSSIGLDEAKKMKSLLMRRKGIKVYY